MDDMKKGFRQAKEMPGNECLKLDCLPWLSENSCREQLHSLVDQESVSSSVRVC